MVKRLAPAAVALLGCLYGQKPPANAGTGQKLFAVSCASCHGRDGTGGVSQAEGVRPPDLTISALTGQELENVITNGKPGTAMPSFGSLGSDRTREIVAFLQSLSKKKSRSTNEITTGEAIFRGRGRCVECHSIHGRGGTFGPDLSRVRKLAGVDDIIAAVRNPDERVAPEYAAVRVVVHGEPALTGIARWFDNISLRLVLPDGTERTFLIGDVTSVQREMTSLMPRSVSEQLAPSELTCLAAYILHERSLARKQ